MSDFIFTCSTKGCHQLTDIDGGLCECCWENGFQKCQDDAAEAFERDANLRIIHSQSDVEIPSMMELAAMPFQDWN